MDYISKGLRIHFTGAGYYYTTEKGQQVSKHYKTIGALRRYAKLWSIN